MKLPRYHCEGRSASVKDMMFQTKELLHFPQNATWSCSESEKTGE